MQEEGKPTLVGVLYTGQRGRPSPFGGQAACCPERKICVVLGALGSHLTDYLRSAAMVLGCLRKIYPQKDRTRDSPYLF